MSNTNAMLVIQPYRHAGTWVFDDETVGLVKEPFVAGVPTMIDRLVADIPNAEVGFRLLFSARQFPGAQVQLVRQYQESEGWWYRAVEYDTTGWLCPALFLYFPAAPEEIWVRAEPI